MENNNSQEQHTRSNPILGTQSVPRVAVWVLITIDTHSVKANYPDPSKNQDSPTRIAHDMGFMFATGTGVESGQRAGQISITALAGDTVCVSATSGSNNFEDSVVLFSMARSGGDEVFSDFIYQHLPASTVTPQSTTQPMLAQITTESFWFHQASVAAVGTRGYKVQFTLYTRDVETGQPVLYGYFSWDVEFTVTRRRSGN